MHPSQAHVSPSSHRSALLPPLVGGNPTQWAFAAFSAVVLLAMLMTYINVVQQQVARGESLRQQWNAPAAVQSAKTAPQGSPLQVAAQQPAAPTVSALRF